jgi:hypothetical protein
MYRIHENLLNFSIFLFQGTQFLGTDNDNYVKLVGTESAKFGRISAVLAF